VRGLVLACLLEDVFDRLAALGQPLFQPVTAKTSAGPCPAAGWRIR
jgi:hypothetical protein